jgi:putative membrane protein
LPWALVALTSLSVSRILLLQAGLFLVLVAVLCLPRVRVALVPPAARRRVAEQAALEQFHARGVARTKDRTGILIFVSLAEHYARIVADEGIAAKVAQSEWQGAVDVLTAQIGEGRMADGFIAAIERCGKVLAENFPPAAENRDELRDRIYLV